MPESLSLLLHEKPADRSTALHQDLVEGASDLIYRADREGCLTFANPAALRITGYAEAELVGRHFMELVRPDFRRRLLHQYQKQIREETPNTYLELPILSRSGQEVWIGQNVQLLREGGRVVGVQGVARDITVQRRIQQALRESEERFRSVVENLGEGLIITDLNDVVIYANAQIAEMTGYAPAELVGRAAAEALLPKEEHARVLSETRSRLNGTRSQYEVRHVRKDGEQIWTEVMGVPFRNAEGAVVGTIGLIKDITARKQAESALLEMKRRAEQLADRMRVVAETATGVVAAASLDDLREVLRESCARVLAFDEFCFAIYDAESGSLTPTGEAPSEWPPAAAKPHLEEVVRERRSRLVGDAAPGAGSAQDAAVCVRGSAIHAPILTEDGVLGLLSVHSRTPGVFCVDDVEVLEAIAGLAASAVVNIQLQSVQQAAEAALRESEERFRILVEGSQHVFFYVHDLEHRFEYLSPSVEHVLGYHPEELVGLPYDVLLTGDDRDQTVHELTHRALTSGEAFSTYVVVTRHRDGHTVPVEVVESPIVRDGRVVGLQGVARDITDHLRAEEALRASEASYRSLFNSLTELVYIQDLEGRFLSVNDSVTAAYGYAREEILGQRPEMLMDPVRTDAAQLQEHFRRAVSGECRRFEFWGRRRDGSSFPKEVVLSPGTYFGQDVVIAVARDVTEWKRAEEALERSEQYFRSLTENSLDVIHVINADGTTRYLSPSVVRILGYDPEALIGRSAAELIHPDDLPPLMEAVQQLRNTAESRTLQFRVRLPDGSWRTFEGAMRNLLDDPVVAGVVVNSRDVTERKQREEESVRLAALSRENPNPVLECDAEGVPVHVNPAADEISRQLGMTNIMGLLPDNHRQLVRSALESGQGFQNVEASVGDRIFAWTYRPHAPANVVHLFAVDITGRRHVEEQLRHEALHDALTGLPNRMLFMERLAHAILRTKRREEFQFAVLFLDLDRFKVINDSVGHHVGDELLVRVAQRLQRCLRTEDTVARFGGDEFAILLEEIGGVGDATRVAERIQAELSAPVNLSGFEVFTSASIGIALSSSAYERPEYLLRNADMAMYRAKANGQARFEVFDRAMHASALARLQLETDLRHALEREEFRLVYQPIVAMDSGAIWGVEALIRWAHPDRGELAPKEFISVAEETGLILPIGQWVIREACRQVRDWKDRFGDLAPGSIGVNLSAKQFSQSDLVEEIGQSLQSHGLDPQVLRLEITESAVMENADTAVVLLGRLKTLGVQISLDDFGTGYSSLSYLHRFPLDALKIDRSFVGLMDQDDRSAQLVQTVLNLARSLGVTAVAEGVDNPSQLTMLREMRCDFSQGYLFSTPLTPPDLESLLQQRPRW